MKKIVFAACALLCAASAAQAAPIARVGEWPMPTCQTARCKVGEWPMPTCNTARCKFGG